MKKENKKFFSVIKDTIEMSQQNKKILNKILD